MQLPEDEGRNAAYQRHKRERLYEMHKIAARFFYKTLMSPQGKAGLDYLIGRGITKESIVRFGLGYAPDSFSALKDHLRSQGFSPDEMLAASLITRNERSSNTYDKFRNRVMFPVFDLRGNVVALSGRLLGDNGPKYLNSNETEIYTKGRQVFGLNLAKNEPEGRLILCEGNLDVVSLSQAGFIGAVAPLGTAFTRDQAQILAKYAKQIVVAFDNDSAGLKATDKALNYLEEQGIPVRVLQMSGAKDPDEYIKTYGKERFANLLQSSKTPIEFRLEKLKAGLDLNDTAMKVDYLRKAVQTVGEIENAVERDVYIVNLAKELNIGIDSVRDEVERFRKRKASTTRRQIVKEGEQEFQGVYDRVNPDRVGNLRAARSEEMILAILVKYPDLWQAAEKALPPEEFVTEFNRRVYAFILQEYREMADLSAPIFAKAFDEKEMARISFFINTAMLTGDAKGHLAECVENIKKEKAKKINPEALSAEELMAKLKGEK
jgi:DNA primase